MQVSIHHETSLSLVPISQGEKHEMKKISYKAFPHPLVSIQVHGILLLGWFALIAMHQNKTDLAWKEINQILLILLPILLCVSAIYANIFGWNAVITIGPGGIKQRRGCRIIRWQWEEIKDITCRTHRPLLMRYPPYPPKFSLISESGDKISFMLTKNIKEHFTDFCSNPELCDKFFNLLKQCDFPFFYD